MSISHHFRDKCFRLHIIVYFVVSAQCPVPSAVFCVISLNRSFPVLPSFSRGFLGVKLRWVVGKKGKMGGVWPVRSCTRLYVPIRAYTRGKNQVDCCVSSQPKGPLPPPPPPPLPITGSAESGKPCATLCGGEQLTTFTFLPPRYSILCNKHRVTSLSRIFILFFKASPKRTPPHSHLCHASSSARLFPLCDVAGGQNSLLWFAQHSAL